MSYTVSKAVPQTAEKCKSLGDLGMEMAQTEFDKAVAGELLHWGDFLEKVADESDGYTDEEVNEDG